MTCLICKKGRITAGSTTVTLERGATTVVFKGVPARVCETCGEVYIDANVSAQLLKDAETAVRGGVEVEVRAFAA